MIHYAACHQHDEFVRLPDADLNECARFGMAQRRRAIRGGYRDNDDHSAMTEGERLRRQAIASVAEGAVCHHFGWPITLDWNGFKKPDIPGHIQVRTSERDSYGMRVRVTDDPGWRVVAVIAVQGRERQPLRLPGWFLASDAMAHPEWYGSFTGEQKTFIVPQSALRPLSELRRILKMEGFSVSDPQHLGQQRNSAASEILGWTGQQART